MKKLTFPLTAEIHTFRFSSEHKGIRRNVEARIDLAALSKLKQGERRTASKAVFTKLLASMGAIPKRHLKSYVNWIDDVVGIAIGEGQ